jgi:hypothetical protein
MIPVNKEILKDEIQWLMEAINEQFDAIILYEGKIPQIEFDIIMENVRKFYENLHMLQRSDDPYSYFEEKLREVPVIKTMVPNRETVEVELDPEPVARPEAALRTEPAPEPVPAEVAAESEPVSIPFEMQVERKPFRPMHADAPADVDLFSDAGSGFTEKLKEAREKTLGPRSHGGKPNDLKSSISINEKFLIINELFSGNLRDYNEMVETLNGFQDLRTAMEYLDLLRKKNMWESGTPVFSRMKELLEKRFI